MERITFLSVLALLVLQCSAEFKPLQRTWKYEGQVHVNNVASGDKNPLSAVWAVRGRLISQNFDDHVVLKFKDVQTTIRNGYESSLSLGDENIYKDVRPDSGAILKPIIVYFGDVRNITIIHEADDPIWSVNMKRGILSSYINIADGTDSPVPQHTLYDICNVTYTVSNVGNDYNVEKTIDHASCVNNPEYYLSTTQWDPTSNEPSIVTRETTYTYSYNGEVNPQNLRKIHSHSIMRYKSMSNVKSVQRASQTKNIVFLSQTDTFEKFDTSSINVYSNLTFNYSKGFEGNRNADLEKKPAAQLIENFNENFDLFQEYFNAVPLGSFEVTNNSISSMFDTLLTMNTSTLQQLSTDIFAKNNNLYQHMFLSFLPYLGTEDSIRFIKSLIENEDENLNDLLAIKILATFPVNLHDHSEALLKEMEPLMNLNVSNSQVKYAGLLSFASLVDDMNANGVLDKQTYRKYVSFYYKNFKETTDYEMKMTYLLGLINMNSDFTDDMIEICTDTSLSHHLRSLAIYGFKNFLKIEGNDVYEHFWPIIKSHTEHYEIRVAALDLLLHSAISYNQFQSIVNWYHDEFQNPDEQHLAHYLYTTFKSLENSTDYFEYLDDYATEALETMKPIKNDRVWTTGNYRMAFTDNNANFGGSLQARLIANPNTNVINVGIFSLDSFAVSLNLGSYTAYVKTEGIPDIAFVTAFINSRDNENPVQHLLGLIRKYGYKIKDFEDAHIELVLFCDNRVVFGMYIDKDNIDHYAENPLFLDLLKLVVDYNSVSYPLMDYTYLVSDLGTGILITHETVEIESYELANFHKIFDIFDSSEETDAIEYNLKYRSIWTYTLSMECYNPLVGASIETYKFANEESLVNIPFSFNLTDFVFKWKHTRDSLNWIQDHVIGTYVDPIVLELYCDSCESITALPAGEMEEQVYESVVIEPIIGVHFNITVSQKSDEQLYLDSITPETSSSFLEIIRNPKINTFSVPFAKPVLLLWHLDMYSTYLADDIFSISIRSEPYYNEPTETVFDLEIDTNDIKNDKDPISGEEFDFSIALTHRKSHNAEVLNYFNATVIYKEKSDSPDSETQPHIEHSYDIKLYNDNGEDKKYKMCIDREVLYPNRRVNKFSLEPVDPTRATSKIQFGNVEQISDACPITYSLSVTEIYTATEKQKQHLQSIEEHARCTTQSEGFRFVPPTADCLAAHKIISQYDACTVYADLTKISGVPDDVVEASQGEFGMKVLEYRRLNETHVTVALPQDLIEKVFKDSSKYLNESQVVFENPGGLMSMSPAVIAYDDHDLQFGVSSACYITPNEIQTFHGEVINNYNTEFGPDAVGFVECINNTQVGLTIQRLGDNSIGFNLWSENNTFVASVQDGKAKIVYNGQEQSETDITDEQFKIYFLDQDVIYVTNGLFDIQYTTEYISVKVLSIYRNYICGLCAGDRK